MRPQHPCSPARCHHCDSDRIPIRKSPPRQQRPSGPLASAPQPAGSGPVGDSARDRAPANLISGPAPGSGKFSSRSLRPRAAAGAAQPEPRCPGPSRPPPGRARGSGSTAPGRHRAGARAQAKETRFLLAVPRPRSSDGGHGPQGAVRVMASRPRLGLRRRAAARAAAAARPPGGLSPSHWKPDSAGIVARTTCSVVVPPAQKVGPSR